MGVTKRSIHSDYINEIASMAKVFAHPARVAILNHISKQEGCICNDLVEEIGLAQPTISQHLKVIGDTGLLLGTYQGKQKCYCLNVKRLRQFRDYLNGFLTKVEQNCAC